MGKIIHEGIWHIQVQKMRKITVLTLMSPWWHRDEQWVKVIGENANDAYAAMKRCVYTDSSVGLCKRGNQACNPERPTVVKIPEQTAHPLTLLSHYFMIQMILHIIWACKLCVCIWFPSSLVHDDHKEYLCFPLVIWIILGNESIFTEGLRWLVWIMTSHKVGMSFRMWFT